MSPLDIDARFEAAKSVAAAMSKAARDHGERAGNRDILTQLLAAAIQLGGMVGAAIDLGIVKTEDGEHLFATLESVSRAVAAAPVCSAGVH
jgi:hypothetical protein